RTSCEQRSLQGTFERPLYLWDRRGRMRHLEISRRVHSVFPRRWRCSRVRYDDDRDRALIRLILGVGNTNRQRMWASIDTLQADLPAVATRYSVRMIEGLPHVRS